MDAQIRKDYIETCIREAELARVVALKGYLVLHAFNIHIGLRMLQ